MQHPPHEYIDSDRLRNDILRTAEFGSIPNIDGHGRTALPCTEPNRHAREYFVDRLDEAELEVEIDSVGNILGRWIPEGTDPETPAVAAGSHLDSVTEGGIFDGVLGVYAALESIRAMQAADANLERPIEVVCFTEEEGSRFSDGVLGSSVAVGDLSIDQALALTDADGVTLEAALDKIGFQGDGRIDASGWDAWIELHVEQGQKLESAGVPAGIVTDITGTVRCHIDIEGEANHAGTTSMTDRTDALAAASELVLDIESTANEIVATSSETAVGTVGEFEVNPGAINVIPGEVHLGIDIRDIQYDSMTRIVRQVRDTLARLEAERNVETTFERSYDIRPVAMSENCLGAIRQSASAIGLETMPLHSGAGHDTMQVATVTDAAMIFAPSRNGWSHSPREWTDWSDCTATTSLLATALHKLASE